MITASQSDSSTLRGRKRKAEELDAEAIYSHILGRLRQEQFFSAIEEDDWEEVTANILVDPHLPALPFTSTPFTEALPFYKDLFREPADKIDLGEDAGDSVRPQEEDPPLPTSHDRYEAATALWQNVLWKGVENHVVMENETSCRTAIDLILLTAVDLAQQQIAEKQDVDEALCARHSLIGPKCRDSDDRKVGSWVVLHQNVDIPDQLLLPGVALNGIFDYLLGVVPASIVRDAFKSEPFLTRFGLYAYSDLVPYIGKSLSSVLKAEARKTMDGEKAWAQVTAQGAALCVLTKRPSVINTLTDGLRWRFVRVSKITDQVLPSQPSPQTASASRRRSQRLVSTQTELPTVPEIKPFKAARTRTLDIFRGRDLAIILRLLTLVILSSPEEFQERAAAAP